MASKKTNIFVQNKSDNNNNNNKCENHVIIIISNILFRAAGDKDDEQNNLTAESNSNGVTVTPTYDVDVQRNVFVLLALP